MPNSSPEAVACGHPPYSDQGGVSQAGFAAHLNVTTGVISKGDEERRNLVDLRLDC
jgi:hypothetical protein